MRVGARHALGASTVRRGGQVVRVVSVAASAQELVPSKLIGVPAMPMSPSHTAGAAVLTDARPDGDDQCPACAHARSDHDALGTRFCAATITSRLARGCICVG